VGAKGTHTSFFNSDTINHNIYANDKEANVNFDIGLAALGEMAAGIADIAAASKLPFFADGENSFAGRRVTYR